MVKKDKPERGYDMVKRNIEFSHVRKHQRQASQRRMKKEYVFNSSSV